MRRKRGAALEIPSRAGKYRKLRRRVRRRRRRRRRRCRRRCRHRCESLTFLFFSIIVVPTEMPNLPNSRFSVGCDGRRR